jgi:D-alanine-D-alanine ligase
MQIHKKRIAVLRGGDSDEYHHSIKTGSFVLKHLPIQYEPVDILIDKKGVWHLNGLEKDPLKILNQVDLVFNALHGSGGEDGKIQHLLKAHGIKHTSSDVIPSYFTNHKGITKNILKNYGIKTAEHVVLKREDINPSKIYEIFSTLPHPVVVKPVDSGSSIAVSVAKNPKELTESIEKVFANSKTNAVLVEEFIDGREVVSGIVEGFRGQDVYVLPAVEVRKVGAKEIFSSEKKALNDLEYTSDFLTNLEKAEVYKLSKLLKKIFDLKSFASFDMIIHPKRGVYVLEINSQPKLHEDSHFVKTFEVVGIEPKHFLQAVIENGLLG